MTIQEMQRTDKAVLLPDDIAEVLGVNPQSIRDQAQAWPGSLGFPVSVIGRRTLIPRKPFLRFIGEKEENAND